MQTQYWRYTSAIRSVSFSILSSEKEQGSRLWFYMLPVSNSKHSQSFRFFANWSCNSHDRQDRYAKVDGDANSRKLHWQFPRSRRFHMKSCNRCRSVEAKREDHAHIMQNVSAMMDLKIWRCSRNVVLKQSHDGDIGRLWICVIRMWHTKRKRSLRMSSIIACHFIDALLWLYAKKPNFSSLFMILELIQ